MKNVRPCPLPEPLIRDLGLRRAYGVPLATIVLLTLGASAQAQTTFVAEPSMTKRPLDVEVTPNGLVAVVRGHAPSAIAADGLTFVDTATGIKLTPSSCVTSAGQGGYFWGPNPNSDRQPSDSLRLTNSRAILVGSRDTDNNSSHDKTYIDVLAIDPSGQPPSITCLAHHEAGIPTSASQSAGWTNDVQITPDESFAILNSSNWIHVVDMSDGSIAQSFNIGGFPAGGCFPEDAVDSVAATNETAIVLTTRMDQVQSVGPRMRTWVYMIDLTTTPPVIALEHKLYTPPPIGMAQQHDYWPHDVTITPNGSLAIVTASRVTAIYDLVQHAFVARDAPLVTARRRIYNEIVDSVETTDSFFVTIATDEVAYDFPQFSGVTSYWVVDVYSIPPQTSPSDPEVMIPKRTWKLRDYMNTSVIPPAYQGTSLIHETPHDLAVDETEAVAVIRTELFNLIVTGLDEPDPQNIGFVMNADWLGVANFRDASKTFVSDSVLIPPGFVKHIPDNGQNPPPQGVFHYALTLGAESKNNPSGIGVPWVARVNVIDLKASPPAVVHVFKVQDHATFPYIYPADLHVGPAPRQFTLRCEAQPWDVSDSGVLGGRDFVQFSIDPPFIDPPNVPSSEIARIGARGRVWAVDSLAVGRFNATSVGETLASSTGHIHVVRVQ